MPSRPRQSRALLDDLIASSDPVAIEAATARLAIAGTPAVRHVLRMIEEAEPRHLPRLIAVLERVGDATTLPILQPLLSHGDPDVAHAAVDAVGVLLDAERAAIASSALDALTTVLLDRARPDAVRLRALDAIDHSLERDVVAPLRAQLLQDPSEAVRRAAAGQESPLLPPVLAPDASLLLAAANGELPDEAEPLRQATTTHGDRVPLTALQRLIQRVRAREETEDERSRRDAWRVVRATAHLALATRGSRLAVYDLRETLVRLGSETPVGMLSALQQVGDASVLDAIAEAYGRTDDAWFRGQLVMIFHAVVARDGVTRRHAVVKKVAARAPEALAALWPPPARQ